jgi:phospholipase C
MFAFAKLWSAVAIVSALPLLAGLNGCSSSPQSKPVSPAGPVFQHVVIVFQENRTPDNLFQDPVLIARGADIASRGKNSLGEIVPLVIQNLGSDGPNPSDYDLNHQHIAFLQMCHAVNGHCRMDGADRVQVTCRPTAVNCPPPNPQFVYVDPNDVGPYFELAERWAFADRMFQTNQGPSFPAHQFILSGTSAPLADSDLFVSENPPNDEVRPTGCMAPAGRLVNAIDPFGNVAGVYPCFEHATLTDLLDTANRSWRYYAGSIAYIWTGPAAIRHMCQPGPGPDGLTCLGPDFTDANAKVAISPSHYPPIIQDIANGNLADVSWVIPSGGQMSDHPMSNKGCGPAWVAAIVNAIGQSKYWQNTAIIITWDDWGGLYDHVPPPIINSYEYGFRVPMIVVSPYTRPQYISHPQHDFGSILKFVEENYGLPSLGYADAKADDLGDIFDLEQPLAAYQPVQMPANADACFADPTALSDVDDD